jgi:hypothetical protein
MRHRSLDGRLEENPMPMRRLCMLAALAASLTGCAARIERGETAPVAPQDLSDRASSAPSTRVEIAGVPQWLRIRLADYDAQTDRSAPRAVYAVTYAGATAYYVQAGCCDQLDPLVDANGVLICHPTGGYTGRGDDRCASKLPPAADRREVWRHR